MTNISNLNLSKGTIPPLLKYKIVFLGDQAVGKSSIINRFIYDIFDGNEHVLMYECRDQQSGSILFLKIYSYKIRLSDCNYGIRQVSKDLKRLFRTILGILLSQ
jgi:GTPase SAR1 family protein